MRTFRLSLPLLSQPIPKYRPLDPASAPTERPEQYPWSSYNHYATGNPGTIEIESEWTAGRRRAHASRYSRDEWGTILPTQAAVGTDERAACQPRRQSARSNIRGAATTITRREIPEPSRLNRNGRRGGAGPTHRDTAAMNGAQSFQPKQRSGPMSGPPANRGDRAPGAISVEQLQPLRDGKSRNHRD